ncbi:AfsR/SARP family transcriptional regulator [Streptomyces sp. NBC_00555]|uniref:AfsR/SARP family transcriptional regulator n=1 Tax=Streptomyces sp. NBC_00555 TaxID=2903662 RepID=UPI00225015BF|nr:AfsR/SARP family transcriptional regulator [Streptomyces sp. NBC_00555]MCX5016673.1 AfsR/SARP family transcriptional regulator [Streptomyces sp. NBC_00555]
MEWDVSRSDGLDFRVLGPVEVHDHRSGTRITPSGAKQRALLAALVVRAGEVLSAERLIDELWGDRPPAGAANALQAHVARLRRLLAPAGEGDPGQALITTHPLGYLLRLGSARTDAQRFTQLSAQGRAAVVADPAHAADLLDRALALWRGPALEGSGRGQICAREAERLEQSRLTALETCYEAKLRGARHAEVTGELERLTAAHPTRERFYDLLMLALYRCGRRSEALGVYERARQRLMSEIGIGPGPALRDRMESILLREPGLDSAGPPPAAAGVDAAALDLGGEIARLRARIDAIGREQDELVRRFTLLSERAREVPSGL